MACPGLGRRIHPHRLCPPAQHLRSGARPQREGSMNDTATALRLSPTNIGSAAATRTAIEIRALDFYYGKQGKGQALKSVNMSVPANSVTAIIGPSGCGKSTLLRTINRIFEMYPDQYATGEIVIDGCNILDRRYPLYDLRRLVG